VSFRNSSNVGILCVLGGSSSSVSSTFVPVSLSATFIPIFTAAASTPFLTIGAAILAAAAQLSSTSSKLRKKFKVEKPIPVPSYSVVLEPSSNVSSYSGPSICLTSTIFLLFLHHISPYLQIFLNFPLEDIRSLSDSSNSFSGSTSGSST